MIVCSIELSIHHTTVLMQLQDDLDHLSLWACDGQMQFNETKRVSMCYTRSQNPIGSTFLACYLLNDHTFLVSKDQHHYTLV